jgi:hypothetical protein
MFPSLAHTRRMSPVTPARAAAIFDGPAVLVGACSTSCTEPGPQPWSLTQLVLVQTRGHGRQSGDEPQAPTRTGADELTYRVKLLSGVYVVARMRYRAHPLPRATEGEGCAVRQRCGPANE